MNTNVLTCYHLLLLTCGLDELNMCRGCDAAHIRNVGHADMHASTTVNRVSLKTSQARDSARGTIDLKICQLDPGAPSLFQTRLRPFPDKI